MLFSSLDNNYLWQDEAATALLGENIIQYGLPKVYDGKNIISQEAGIDYDDNFLHRWTSWGDNYIAALSMWMFGISTFGARFLFVIFGFAAMILSINTIIAQENSKKLVPINIELPDPMFVGTPTNMQVENLEKPLGKPRPPFLAPDGTNNVALGKPVTSTDDFPIIGEIPMITDGNKDADDGFFVELGPFTQHITIDLGKDFNIYALVVWHYHKQPVVYFDVIIQVADDKDFTKNVRTLFNNDIDNSSGQGKGNDKHYVETAEGKLIDAKGEVARFVRLYSNGNNSNDLNHYIEVSVYGKE